MALNFAAEAVRRANNILNVQEHDNRKAADKILTSQEMQFVQRANIERELALHVQAIPMRDAYETIWKTFDPIMRVRFHRVNKEAWKSVAFITGRKVKEGSRLYRIHDLVKEFKEANSLNNAQVEDGSMLMGNFRTNSAAINKDAMKAYLLYRTYPASVLTELETAREYITSDGFNEIFLGKTQKMSRTA